MKNKIFLALLIQLICLTGFSQTVVWHNVVGGNSEEYGNAIALDNAGNVITTGNFRTTCYGSTFALVSQGNTDIFIQKLSADGAFLWVKQLGGANSDSGHTITTDSAGNIYVAGTFLGTINFGSGTLNSSTSSSNFFLIKVSPTGDILWRKALPGTISDKPKIVMDATDNLYFSGAFEGTRTFGTTSLNSHNGRGFVAKINTTNGDIAWATQFGSGTTLNGQPVAINVTTTHLAVDSLNNVYVTGGFVGHGRFGTETFIMPNSTINTFIFKLNAQGVFQWTKLYYGTSEGTSIVVDSDNNFYTTGKFKGTVTMNNTDYTTPDAANYSIYLEKFDANANLVWFKTYDMNSDANSIVIPQLAIDNQANLFFKCHFYNTITFEGTTYNHLVSTNPNILKNQILATFTTNGVNTWANQYEGSNDYVTFGLRPDKNTNIAITNAGLFFTSGSSKFNSVAYSGESGANIFTAKLTLPNLLNQTSFDAENLVQISPNPTKGNVHLNLKNPNSPATIVVYNTLGQKIAHYNPRGLETFEINLPATVGVYFFEITIDNQRIVKKIVKN